MQDLWVASDRMVRNALPVAEVPENVRWRLGLLDILLRNRADLEREGSDKDCLCYDLFSLCNVGCSLLVSSSFNQLYV